MDRLINVIKDVKGQTIVEFALIVTLLLALLFGIMEFARAWQYSNALTNGVRAGVRFATFKNSTAGVRDYTFTQISSADISLDGFTHDDISVTINNSTTITVGVTYDFDILTGSIIPFFSGTRQLQRQATMRFEE